MRSFKVKLKTVADAGLFVATCGNYKCDIDYIFGRYAVDAKSLVGVLCIGVEHKCEVVLHTDDDETVNNFKKDIELWLVKEN